MSRSRLAHQFQSDQQHNQTLSGRRPSLSDILHSGALVCLRDQGHLVIVRPDANNTWQCEIDYKNYDALAQALPAEALFIILRDERTFSIQSLGAEGRLIHVDANRSASHRLSYGFVAQSKWELADGTVRSIQCKKELGFEIEPVTAIPTEALEQMEKEQLQRIVALQQRVKRLEQDGNQDGWSSDSGSFAGAQEREIDQLKQQLDEARAIAAHWQQKATEQQSSSGKPSSVSRQSPSSNANASLALEQMQKQMQEQEDQHQETVQKLTNERIRLLSALRFIKGMTDGMHNESADANDDASEPVEEEDHPALGIPVGNTDIPLLSKEPSIITSEDIAAPSASTSTFHVSFPNIAGTSRLYNLLNPSENGTIENDGRVNSNNNPLYSAEDDVIHLTRENSGIQENGDSNCVTPDFDQRKQVSDGCFLVDYNGAHPDIMTEQSMERILDGPMQPLMEDHSLPCLQSPQLEADCTPVVTRAGRNSVPGVLSAPVSAFKDEEKQSPSGWGGWPAGTMSLPGSTSATPHENGIAKTSAGGNGVTDACPGWLSSEDSMQSITEQNVRALDCASPASANLLTHYMTDQMINKHSFEPEQRASQRKSRERYNTGRSQNSAGTPNSSGRSSFLTRPPVAETDLYGKW